LRSDVKAVTKHLYDVHEHKGQWIARVVLDI
jgi:SHS2 domain-containing protein